MEDLQDHLSKRIGGKTVLITGGTTGIGLAAATMLASLGAKIFILGRDKKKLKDALKELQSLNNPHVFGMIADVSQAKDITEIFNEVDSKFGKLDVLINNASVPYGGVLEGSHSDRNYAISTNIGGYLACAYEAVTRMKSNQSGHIINVGSMSTVAKVKGSSVYVAAKSGIKDFSEVFRKEVSEFGIKVSLIEPGAVDTEMQKDNSEEKAEKIKAKEMLDAADIAAGIVYCLSQSEGCTIATLQIMPMMQQI